MKGYKRFLFVFVLMLSVYILAEMNRPKPLEWKITLSQDDKNPYGAYILYHQLKDLFPQAGIHSYRLPVYNLLHNAQPLNTAYILMGEQLGMTDQDTDELLKYASAGNYVFLASASFSKPLRDSLKFKVSSKFDFLNQDSTTINFKNPSLHRSQDYGFKRMTMGGFFNQFDTAHALLLGHSRLNDINFIRIPFGKGAFLVHALPLCFSNYFMLTDNNADYTAKALSYLPANISRVYWDEYYKMGPIGSGNPLRFVLTNTWLRWAFRTGIVAMALFVVFGMKRRQRIIPVIEPLRNTTLDFVQTVGNVYFNQHDNQNIASKKISYFLEHVRSGFYLSTSQLSAEFAEALASKADKEKGAVVELVELMRQVQEGGEVSDATLLELNRKIDHFYTGSTV